MKYNLITLGQTVRQLRKQRSLSQEGLSQLCGLHRTYICDIERGARNITIGSLMKVALALKTDVSTLTKDIEKNACSPEKQEGCCV